MSACRRDYAGPELVKDLILFVQSVFQVYGGITARSVVFELFDVVKPERYERPCHRRARTADGLHPMTGGNFSCQNCSHRGLFGNEKGNNVATVRCN